MINKPYTEAEAAEVVRGLGLLASRLPATGDIVTQLREVEEFFPSRDFITELVQVREAERAVYAAAGHDDNEFSPEQEQSFAEFIVELRAERAPAPFYIELPHPDVQVDEARTVELTPMRDPDAGDTSYGCGGADAGAYDAWNPSKGSN